jgi:4'-phosphopantetheinyl transferase
MRSIMANCRYVSPMQPGVVEVWRADLAAADDAVLASLSAEERARAARFVRQTDGRRWARARGILRAILGAELGIAPAQVELRIADSRKPELAAASPLRFNLSHSGEVALYALALDREVGVDVETRERPLDVVAIARRTLGPVEAERLAAVHPDARHREFLQAWARHEAELKCGVPDPWVADLDIGPAAAVAVERGPCEVRVRSFQSFTPSRLRTNRAP